MKTKAKKAIAGFKIREGLPIGCKVTLRKQRMYEFLDRLVTIALPRVRDFRGIPGNKGFDGRGNFAMGLKDQTIFAEIAYDKIDTVRGMDIIFVTTARTDCRGEGAAEAVRYPVRGRDGYAGAGGLNRVFGKPLGTSWQVPRSEWTMAKSPRSTAT